MTSRAKRVRPARAKAIAPIHQADGPRTAKVFWSGRSQAIRLPRDFRLAESEVTIRKDGNRLVLEPHRVDANGWPADFFQIFGALDGSFDVGDRATPHERNDLFE